MVILKKQRFTEENINRNLYIGVDDEKYVVKMSTTIPGNFGSGVTVASTYDINDRTPLRLTFLTDRGKYDVYLARVGPVLSFVKRKNGEIVERKIWNIGHSQNEQLS